MVAPRAWPASPVQEGRAPVEGQPRTQGRRTNRAADIRHLRHRARLVPRTRTAGKGRRSGSTRAPVGHRKEGTGLRRHARRLAPRTLDREDFSRGAPEGGPIEIPLPPPRAHLRGVTGAKVETSTVRIMRTLSENGAKSMVHWHGCVNRHVAVTIPRL